MPTERACVEPRKGVMLQKASALRSFLGNYGVNHENYVQHPEVGIDARGKFDQAMWAGRMHDA